MEPEEYEKYLDPQLWHACAGNLVHMPTVNSEVFYFPQGHAEHSSSTFDFRNFPRIQSHVPCRVSELKFMADPETDEVFAKIRLLPLTHHHQVVVDDDNSGNNLMTNASDNLDKPTSFVKTLTQSDTNNGGGFSVPKHCAETIFPQLDGSTDPPSQTILAKDVHGETWKFRHIYRGTPKRHLLTTGWTDFVNRKKLVVGDSIVFFRQQNRGDLCIGIRRAKRGGNEGRLGRAERFADMGRVKPEDVMEAASLTSKGQPFTVVYYPRAGAPEFCVEASRVSDALKLRYRLGMRFKMDFEEEKSLRVRSFMGTVSSVNAADFIRWPDSPWRFLEVNWDEHNGVLKDVKRVSPWLVEIVSDTSTTIQLPQFSSPHKKPKQATQQQDVDFLDEYSIPLPNFSGDDISNSSSDIFLSNIDSPVSIQGARHSAQYTSSSSSDHRFNNKRLPLFQMVPRRSSSSFMIPKPDFNESVSSNRITLENSNSNLQGLGRSDGSDKEEYSFKLFGKTIIVEKQNSPSCNEITSDDKNVEKTVNNALDESGSVHDPNDDKGTPSEPKCSNQS